MLKIQLNVSKLSGYDLIALILTLTAILTTYIRLYFGIDFIDESYSVTLAYQYSLGAKAFVDDISPLVFAILTFPFVKLYVWIIGSSDGIILFTRHLYFFFNLLTASLVFLGIHKFLRWSTALLISLTCVVFIPFNIPNLSYNTIGIGFLTAGCFLGIWVILNRKNPACLFLSGLCHGFATFSYPPLIVPSFIYLICLIWVQPNQKKSSLLSYILGGLPPAVLLIKICLDAGIRNVLASFSYARSLGYLSGVSKVASILKSLWMFYPYKSLILIILILLYFCIKKARYAGFRNAFLLLPLIPTPIIYSGYTQHCGCLFSIGYLFYYTLLTPYLLVFLSKNRELKILIYLGWLPSFIAGFFIAYNSGNGYFNTGLGMLSASVVTTIISIKTFLSLSRNKNADSGSTYRELFAPCLVILFLAFSQYQVSSLKNMVYLDADIQHLNSKIDSGPFAGLYTTEEKKDYLYELYNDLNAVAHSEDKVLFYFNNFPAGYLLTSMRSASNVSFWVEPKYYSALEVRQKIGNYIRNNLDNNSVIIVKMKRLLLWDYTSFENLGNDFISQIIEDYNSSLIVSKENFDIRKINQ